jgi:hypothetical protein
MKYRLCSASTYNNEKSMKLANIASSGVGVGLVLPPLHSHPQPLPACVLY